MRHSLCRYPIRLRLKMVHSEWVKPLAKMRYSFFNQFLAVAFAFSTVLLAMSGGLTLLVPPAIATVLYTADPSGSVIVQSRRTLRDQNHYSWQAIAFKPILADGRVGGLALRLVGFPGMVEIVHPQAIVLTRPQGQRILIADISEQISANLPPQPHVGQYDLQAALPQSIDYRLQLELPTRPLTQPPTRLQLSPALLQEWQAIANIQPGDVIRACDKFPIEAQHHPDFPGWVGCPAAGDR
jgi:Protein of unknown function (DUF3122)